MRTLALRGGARVAVVTAEWSDAFGLVMRGRVQLELRDGKPGPVLRRGAGFWLRGTGVRALRNPGRRTARVRIATRASESTRMPVTQLWRNDMNNMDGTGVVARPGSGQTTHRFRRLAATGLIATLVAMATTTLAAALAQAVGVDFEIPDGGEAIPLPGFAVMTGFFSVVGVVIAAALLRWSARPAGRFAQTAVTLTAISLVAPLISAANTATIIALLVLHLLAATVTISALARSLRATTG